MSQMRLFSLKMNDGHFMPMLGSGTSAPSKLAKGEVETAVKRAIDVGYRHIDSAYLYQNDEEIGRATQEKMADGTVKRDDIFYTTKVWGTFFRPELVQTGLQRSLRKLQLSYVDLCLIHYPIALKPGEDFFPRDTHGKIISDPVELCATWELHRSLLTTLPPQAMEKCKDAGLAKSIGVSNFNHEQLEKILNKPGLKHKPVCNQVECHPYLNQSKLLEFCTSKDVLLVAYAPLGSESRKAWVKKNHPALLQDPVLGAIAEKHGRTPAQVALRYQLQRRVVALAKSFNEERMKENFQVNGRVVGG
nr:aldo-keto reductase family 1 member C15-like isoform X1 [Vicugna pacos]XP_031526740.1 aldo-keto reductase family 1 member C15-like isoform X1 [Vicugna pacos]XP_031526741.1 aldo-keto reductase family 1 member C15-like isoform X1 [Vicugna pacos]XP_031526742.1 aldo-keto reductase family 1 member C15-like isoform X1 [Vicugna pacos]XP_031526743.1 aldo-keto reductase family 1 member C15-like isoform X1 [Vicugna pacos]XP_031526744.1 aldo-keto reductase family 1 member C15-like isoform X1 [Vicugna 